jgi:hypothetical protein
VGVVDLLVEDFEYIDDWYDWAYTDKQIASFFSEKLLVYGAIFLTLFLFLGFIFSLVNVNPIIGISLFPFIIVMQVIGFLIYMTAFYLGSVKLFEKGLIVEEDSISFYEIEKLEVLDTKYIGAEARLTLSDGREVNVLVDNKEQLEQVIDAYRDYKATRGERSGLE